ncbi:MAG: amidohydrolase family protein [Lachnospiraceae bacterium]|nr:amidohydrolase family protein [Lachnospiraceae bacterium]
MPGLIDMHTHLRMYSGKGLSDPLRPCAVTLDELLFAQFYLDNGYTTVRDVGDNIANPAIALRNHINGGRITGPRIFCSGPTLTPTEFGFDAAWSEPNHYEVDGPESMRKMVRFCIQKGSRMEPASSFRCFWKKADAKAVNVGMLVGAFVSFGFDMLVKIPLGLEIDGVLIGAALCLVICVGGSLFAEK